MKNQFDFAPDKLKKLFTCLGKYTLTAAFLLLTCFGALSFTYKQQERVQTVQSNQITKTSSGNHNVGKRVLPIYCVKTDQPQVSLTFDVAWGNEDIPQIMDILTKHNVKATFFITGEWIEKFPEDVKTIASLGHDLGNHGDHHKHMSQISNEQKRSEIKGAHDKIKEVTGKDINLFRPPYGDYDNDVITVAQDMNYYSVQWDVDSLDWKDYGSESIINTVVNHKHLGNGSIVLLHTGTKYTLTALEDVILGLKEKEFELVPASELIIRDHYHLDHEGRQIAD